jgi:hypothetical protein
MKYGDLESNNPEQHVVLQQLSDALGVSVAAEPTGRASSAIVSGS